MRQFGELMLGSVELFCLAAEQGSFSAAATAAGVTPAAVSRAIARLEARLGVRLFIRTTRQIRLTDGGRAYFEQCKQALGQLLEAEREVTGQQLVPAGTLRISLPTTYGHYRVLPLLPAFRARYPAVNIDVHLSNRNVDFADEGFDLAIRARAPVDSTLTARKLEDAELVVVAAPAYLARHGTPQTLAALADHDCIQFLLPSSGKPISWLFRENASLNYGSHDNGGDRELATVGSYCCSEDILGGVTLARSGAGLFQTYRFIVADDLRNGNLIEVLQEHGGRSRPFSMLYPHGRHLSRRVRAFVDFLLEALAD